MRRVGITGAGGLLGWHLRARLHARGEVSIVPIHTEAFSDEAALRDLIASCDVLVHCACKITGEGEEILRVNKEIDERLTSALDAAGRPIPLVFASSTHVERATPYGEAKRRSEAHLARWAEARGAPKTSLLFSNIFGEGGRPFHNSVVATFCHQVARGLEPTIFTDAELTLIHAQDAAGEIIEAMEGGGPNVRRPGGTRKRVSEILQAIREIDGEYRASGVVPDLRDPFRLSLFNTYRSHLFPDAYPTPLALREDARGALFEAVKTRHGGQAFLSTTKPGITRGNHFHLRKLERFCVVKGSAVIRIRRLFSDKIHAFEVSGNTPVVIDIPTLHSHTIQSTSDEELLTLFWSSEIYNPADPDTYAEPVQPEIAPRQP
ncbi:MAG TPA: NAD-dependent epimerase/dehydratase family protein [Polyangiaceae bacterium]|nr:NAD-dependent epimerase/dehydratase family protein [Polyangiaceae bacterium]